MLLLRFLLARDDIEALSAAMGVGGTEPLRDFGRRRLVFDIRLLRFRAAETRCERFSKSFRSRSFARSVTSCVSVAFVATAFPVTPMTSARRTLSSMRVSSSPTSMSDSSLKPEWKFSRSSISCAMSCATFHASSSSALSDSTCSFDALSSSVRFP